MKSLLKTFAAGALALGLAGNAHAADNDLKMARIFAEGQAKIEILRQTSQAKIDIMKQESIARILTHNAEMQADLRRKEILARAQGSI